MNQFLHLVPLLPTMKYNTTSQLFLCFHHFELKTPAKVWLAIKDLVSVLNPIVIHDASWIERDIVDNLAILLIVFT